MSLHATLDERPLPAVASLPPLAELVGSDLVSPLVTGGAVRYVNLDLAASAPALRAVVDRVTEFLPYCSSVHRGSGYASMVSTSAYETSRRVIAAFVGARPDDVVQVVRNTTDAFNLLAAVVPGEVVHLDLEHHANLLPWQARGARGVEARETLEETLSALELELLAAPAALLAVTGASNVTGELLPVQRLAALAHRHGARIAVDAAQWAPHRRIDVAGLGVDYLALSGHKLYAPYGAGVLVGRRDWLDAAAPHLLGGGAVREVSLGGVTWAAAPARHEAGTPNVVGAVALAAACEVIGSLPDGALERHEGLLRERLVAGLDAVAGVRRLELWPGEAEAIGVVTFGVDGHSAEAVAHYLSAEWGIGVRDGRFCAHPLLQRLNGGRTAVRASLGLGSSSEDVDRLVEALRHLVDHGPTAAYGSDHLPDPDPRPLPAWARWSGPPRACS
ncbi:aminotransferase class V-fold PLP-dependent enzyme [Nocardioides jishulii]|uniref:Aminotransferase class V-fold PLP-dependent enzyme n=1 Tax=Nocardioides jishulii TaxID=2575440 RepID=A0A4U2YNI2_9ACTN|nr:aminotransferase class V-fold PLP-dependent enzyme [Nocardioides jishulii]QCX26878.1 aminotransferase class V-fold PLP-dependent enzyme [Nocardioides jishulii]TKI61361.1 aminotransferase class V-fold PLP-dependent enzyme [Nocardioides jishulii]